MTRTALLMAFCIIWLLGASGLIGTASAAPLELYVSPSGSIPDAFPSLTDALQFARDQEADLTVIYLEPGVYYSHFETFPIEIEKTVYLCGIRDTSKWYQIPQFSSNVETTFWVDDGAKLVLSNIYISPISPYYGSRGIDAGTGSEVIAMGCVFYKTAGSYLGSCHYGGASSYARFVMCDFSYNLAVRSSAGIRMVVDGPSRSPHLVVTDSTFRGNMSDFSPCLSWLDLNPRMPGEAVVADCIFEGNSGGVGAWTPYIEGFGIIGASSTTGRSTAGYWAYTVRNCLFIKNPSHYGGAIGVWGGSSSVENTTLIQDRLEDTNEWWGYIGTGRSILWGEDNMTDWGAAYSCVQGGHEGRGNIDENPLFTFLPGNTDEHLRYFLSSTAAGQGKDSPCIDAGGVSVEEAGMQFYTTRTDFAPDTGTVDMGFHYRIAPRLVMDVEPVGGCYSVLLSCGASRYSDAEVDAYLAAVSPEGELYTFSDGAWQPGIRPLAEGLHLFRGYWHGPFYLTDIPASAIGWRLYAALCKPGTLDYACEPAIYEVQTPK
ncbi:MAG TPA: hypothetical protein VM163_02295 [bacterium]|nr:hypothetical protein [bacterium]